jgi:hypothetical protein
MNFTVDESDLLTELVGSAIADAFINLKTVMAEADAERDADDDNIRYRVHHLASLYALRTKLEDITTK